ncbi:rhamnogalacturonan acetylesterase [Sphingomonas crusticola]|uniref:rhamnogalacturonan acetylesterase n=1 Tax=Sphingomonas crusticola TaxID=1697973 RepID=UPI001F084EED|nr:rhamnogalacturonan acetylesterase [Sphingomonas crusticola]
MAGGLALSVAAHAQAAPATAAPSANAPIKASKIILVGDSTMAVSSGWGASFCALHVSSFLACINLARGGRSSGSYRAEGSWALALNEMRVPGYQNRWVLIQFGHNDQPGKPGRSTDLRTEFPVNIRHYVEEARAAGAKPVLVTPLTRRMFKDGKLDNDLAPWADAIRKVAADLRVPLLDLNAESSTAVQGMGPANADRLAQVPESGAAPATAAVNEVDDQPIARAKRAFDHTHLGTAGADYFSAMVTRELWRAVPEIRGLLVR